MNELMTYAKYLVLAGSQRNANKVFLRSVRSYPTRILILAAGSDQRIKSDDCINHLSIRKWMRLRVPSVKLKKRTEAPQISASLLLKFQSTIASRWDCTQQHHPVQLSKSAALFGDSDSTKPRPILLLTKKKKKKLQQLLVRSFSELQEENNPEIFTNSRWYRTSAAYT